MANKRPYEELERAFALGQVETWFRTKPVDSKMVVLRALMKQLNDDELRRALHVTNREKKRRKARIPVSASQVSAGIEQRVVALDVEKVVGLKNPLTNKHQQLAGRVAVVARIDGNIKTIFHAYVHQPHEAIHSYATRYSGLTRDSLKDGMSPMELKEKLDEIFLGAKVVTYDGTDDFKSCGIMVHSYDTYDIRGCPEFARDDEQRSPKGLKVLVQEHYQDLNFQQSKAHDPKWDAYYTLRLFEDYCIPYAK